MRLSTTFDDSPFPDRHPADSEPIELGSAHSVVRDRDDDFWQQEERELRGRFKEQIHSRIVAGRISHISVFALAPQPLLMLLGALLTDIKDVDVFGHHKEPKGWRWCPKADDLRFSLTTPPQVQGQPVLVLSVSGTITTERVVAVVPAKASLWRVDIQDPHNDCLKTREHLRDFRQFMRRTLDRIKVAHGQDVPLHIIPAMPAAMAIELGRIRSPKADATWKTYDQVNARGGFTPAIILNSEG